MSALIVIVAGLIDSIFFSLWSRFDQGQAQDEQSHGKSPQSVNNFLISFIGSIWMSYGMFILLKHIRPNGIVELISIPVGCWLMIIMTIAVKEQINRNENISQVFVGYIKYLVSLIIISLIVGNY